MVRSDNFISTKLDELFSCFMYQNTKCDEGGVTLFENLIDFPFLLILDCKSFSLTSSIDAHNIIMEMPSHVSKITIFHLSHTLISFYIFRLYL